MNNDNYSDKNMWRCVRDMTNQCKQQPPRILKINGIFTTSLRKITNECNNYFVTKIQKLRDKFQQTNSVTAIEILKYLIPRVNQNIIFKKIDRQGVKKLLKQAKATNSLGNDIVSMKTIKKLGHCIEPYIEHLINTIIESENYPNIFKVSKITPTLKPDKSANLIDSYRPINNLSSFEKLVEQHLKNCIIDHLVANNIFLSNHHGSLKHHSTTTALASINHHLNTNYHNNNATALI